MENAEQPIVFGEQSDPDQQIIQPEKVSERDIFKFAKQILFVCCLVFVLVVVLRVTADPDNKAAIDVWEYSKILLNSIISLVLGLYFGTKSRLK